MHTACLSLARRKLDAKGAHEDAHAREETLQFHPMGK